MPSVRGKRDKHMPADKYTTRTICFLSMLMVFIWSP